MGVHVYELADQLRKMDDVELTVLGVDYMTQQGCFFLVGDSSERMELRDWVPTKNHWRFLQCFNTNNVYARHGFITKILGEDVFMDNVISLREKNEEFDIIHLHDCHLWRVAKVASQLFKCPIAITNHLNFFMSNKRYPSNPFYLYNVHVEAVALQRACALIAVSKSYADALQRTFFLQRKPVVIYNGVDSKFLSTVKCDPEVRKRFPLDKRLVVYVGRIVPTKGVGLLLKAIPKLKECHFVFISTVAPTEEDVVPLMKGIHEAERTCDNFTWLNQLPDEEKWRIMKVADVGVMPSQHEPFGIVALEWMGIGTPLIVSQAGGLAEFCNAKNSTLLKQGFTAKDLMKAIKGFERDESKVTEGLKTVQAFTWEETARKTAGVYRRVRERVDQSPLRQQLAYVRAG